MQIRMAKPADASAMSEIEKSVVAYPWSLSEFLQTCRHERRRSLVIVDDSNDIVGFAVYEQVFEEITLLNIAVAKDKQGNGAASKLLASILEEQTSGAQRILLEVRESNSPALALYKKFGFQLDGRRRGYYPAPAGREDALLMSLCLEPGP